MIKINKPLTYRNQFGVKNQFGTSQKGIITPIGKGIFRNDNWTSIVNYVFSEPDIKKTMCVGCGSGKLFDVNDKPYPINKMMTLEQVKSIVSLIKQINHGKTD